MKVLTPSDSAQTFKVIPREYVSTATLMLTDDSTDTVTTYSDIVTTTDVNHLSITQVFSPALVEGRFYDMVLKNVSNEIIYTDKIFCTAQDIDQTQNQEYTVNSGQYISDTSFDNDFIIV